MLMRWIRALSLDVVAGGVAGAAFAAHVTGARMPRLASHLERFDRYRNAEWLLLLMCIPPLLARLA